MKLIELKEPPKDIGKFIKAKECGSIDMDEVNLRELIKQGASNIEAKGCSLATITKLEAELAQNGYSVQFVQIAGMTSFADFYLEKF